MRTKHYSEYISQMAAMMGMVSSDLGDTEKAILNVFFDGGIKKIWRTTNWLETTRTGEYRVANNQLASPNDFFTGSWNQIGVSISENTIPNPVDVYSNARRLAETGVYESHRLLQNVSYISGTPQSLSIFARPSGTNFLFITLLNNTGAVYEGAFDLINRRVVSHTSGVTGVISNPGELWSQCTIHFTPEFGSHYVEIALSNDGINKVYAGNSNNGVYLWGSSLIQSGTPGISTQIIPWQQSGYPEIDTVYEVYNRSPLNSSTAGRIGYKPTVNGIQLFGVTSSFDSNQFSQTPQASSYPTGSIPFGPVYIDYRVGVPTFSGPAWTSATTYYPGDVTLAPNADGSTDFYKCLVFSNGSSQSPQADPIRWELQPIPYSFFEFVCLSAFSEWLKTEGQFAKAEVIANRADALLVDELERQEREMGVLPNFKVNTHLTSRTSFI
jgi:hypothetical protein